MKMYCFVHTAAIMIPFKPAIDNHWKPTWIQHYCKAGWVWEGFKQPLESMLPWAQDSFETTLVNRRGVYY